MLQLGVATFHLQAAKGQMIIVQIVTKNKSIFQGEASELRICPQCDGCKKVRLEHSGEYQTCNFCRGEGVVEHRSHYQHFHPDVIGD